MKRELKYSFKYIDKCNMCGTSSETHKILDRRINQSQGKNLRKKKIGISTTILTCPNCGLVYSNPQPVPLNIQDHYNVPAEDYWQDARVFTIE